MNGKPRARRRPRLRVTRARAEERAGAPSSSSVAADRIPCRLRCLRQGVAEGLQHRTQRLSGDQLRDHRVGPDRLVRICHQVPALPDLRGGGLERRELIHGPPPTWPVVTGVSLSHCSGAAAVICPAGMCRVWSNRACEYQLGPGISRTLSSAPPYFLAKSGVNTLSGGAVPFLINGSMWLAIRVQCDSFVLMSTC